MATLKTRQISQEQFYKLCKWVEGMDQPVSLTIKQLTKEASNITECDVSELSVLRVIETTGVKMTDPRQKNFKGSDRVIRCASGVLELIKQMESQFGFVPENNLKQTFQSLCDRKGE